MILIASFSVPAHSDGGSITWRIDWGGLTEPTTNQPLTLMEIEGNKGTKINLETYYRTYFPSSSSTQTLSGRSDRRLLDAKKSNIEMPSGFTLQEEDRLESVSVHWRSNICEPGPEVVVQRIQSETKILILNKTNRSLYHWTGPEYWEWATVKAGELLEIGPTRRGEISLNVSKTTDDPFFICMKVSWTDMPVKSEIFIPQIIKG